MEVQAEFKAMTRGNGALPKCNESEDRLVEQLREARDAPTVYKAMLASLRATDGDSLVFVCEGVDDKKVYFHWIRHVDASISCEFLVCNGKDKVLKFRNLLKRDLSGLDRNVFFVIDRDFDGLRGYDSGDDIYVTEAYSFENYLVNSDVLDKVLAVDMHCHGDPHCRARVAEVFMKTYSSFLEITRPHNKRIYLAYRFGIPIRSLPGKIGRLASVSLMKVERLDVAVQDSIRLDREPSEVELDECESDFSKLDPITEYRGKFALFFFLRWLGLVAKDRNSADSQLFSKAKKVEAKANEQLTLDSLASKSVPPAAFEGFVKAATANRHSRNLNSAAAMK